MRKGQSAIRHGRCYPTCACECVYVVCCVCVCMCVLCMCVCVKCVLVCVYLCVCVKCVLVCVYLCVCLISCACKGLLPKRYEEGGALHRYDGSDGSHAHRFTPLSMADNHLEFAVAAYTKNGKQCTIKPLLYLLYGNSPPHDLESRLYKTHGGNKSDVRSLCGAFLSPQEVCLCMCVFLLCLLCVSICVHVSVVAHCAACRTCL